MRIWMDETAFVLADRRGEDFDAVTTLLISEGSAAAWAPLSRRLATLARSQNDLFLRIAAQAARAHEGLEEAKRRYQRYCRATRGGYYDDPFLSADIEEVSREREVQRRIVQEQLASAPPPTGGRNCPRVRRRGVCSASRRLRRLPGGCLEHPVSPSLSLSCIHVTA